MKYIVMECHKAYAVLMDEASRVVHAANLHYEVGQVVESPVLLQEQNTAKPRISAAMKRCMAAAACIALMAGAGALYYQGNYTAYSSIVVCAAANVRMEVSRSGKVLSVQPLNQDAADLLVNYECSGKDQLTVTGELIDRAVENGYVQKGDTVSVFYEKKKGKDAEKFEEHVGASIESHELHADIRRDVDQTELPQPEIPVDPKIKPSEEPQPPTAPQHGEEDTPAPTAPHEQQTPAPDPEEKPQPPTGPAEHEHEHAVEPPAAPADPGTESGKEHPVPPEDPRGEHQPPHERDAEQGADSSAGPVHPRGEERPGEEHGFPGHPGEE